MSNSVGKAEKATVYSSETSELETNSIAPPDSTGVPNDSEFQKENPVQDHDSLKKYRNEIASFRNFSGEMRSRELQDIFNTKLHAHENIPRPQIPPTTGNVVGSSPSGDDLGNAAATGDLNRIKELIAKGVNINSPDSRTGMTPLMRAAQTGKLDAMKLLLSQKPKPDVDVQDKEQRTAMYWAAENKQSDALALLNQHKADPNIKARFSRYPIMEAARNGDPKSVKVLSSRADVNKKDDGERTALMEAAEFGNAETVQALLDAHADIIARDKRDRTALIHAAQKGKGDSVKVLVDKINTYESPELRSQMINAKDNEERNALMSAAISGKKDAVAELLKSKEIKVNEQDRYGNSALMDAAVSGNAQSVQLLLDSGAIPDLKDNVVDGKGGKTALMKAAEIKGNSDAVKVLANSQKPKVNLNVQDGEGNTALMHAVTSQDLDSVKALVAAGARLDLKAGGKTAAMIAQAIRQKATTQVEQAAADAILQALANPPKNP